MAETPIKSGARVGNYILKEEIGKGAFSHVWKAVHHERPKRVVAVKIATEQKFRRQLSREGRLPEIDHPNVVPILDSDTRFAEIPYIVMPYLAGGSLRELIAEHPNGLPEEQVEALLGDILEGLAAAHSQGIVHRDVKPSNVLLDGDGRALLSDFGLSLIHAGPDADQSILQSASVSLDHVKIAGTFAYMAPEVREGEPATSASDIYSVGVLLFEMLTGRRPAGPELPSEALNELGRSDFWDALYREACRPSANRPEDTETLLNGIKTLVNRMEEAGGVPDGDEDSKREEEQGTSEEISGELVEQIKEKVIKIVSEQMGVDKSEVTMETSFVNDLNADSLDAVELVMEFEDEFELSIPDEDAERVVTVGDVVRSVCSALGYTYRGDLGYHETATNTIEPSRRETSSASVESDATNYWYVLAVIAFIVWRWLSD